MKCQVTCGDYQTILDRSTHYEAAYDAMQLWSYKSYKPQLSGIIDVKGARKTIYLTTNNVLDRINNLCDLELGF